MTGPKTSAAKTKTTTKTTQTSAQTVAPTRTESPTPSGTGAPVRTEETAAPTAPATPTARSTVEYGRRLNVTINVAVVANAFHRAAASRSVRYVQYALHERGFEPGNDRGLVDYDTRKAYAEFQRSIDERPTGVPTSHSLDVLGFDVT
jgi:hypothetical protein